MTDNKPFSTFNYYRIVKKNSVKVLMENGIKVRDAFNMIKENMPYMFEGKTALDKYDKENREIINNL